MKNAPIPAYEDARLCAVFDLKILDTASEERFDTLTREAIERFAVPISTLTIVDKDREWYKSVQGLSTHEAPRNISFCGHALIQQEMLVIEDTLLNNDFADNPMVRSLENPIRFYAGKSLYDRESNLPVGVFCIKDYKPRTLSVQDIGDFLELASRAEDEINKK